MRLIWAMVPAVAVVLCLGCVDVQVDLGNGGQDSDQPAVVSGQLIAAASAGATRSELFESVAQSGASVLAEEPIAAVYLVGFSESHRQQVRNALEASELFEGVEDNHVYETQRTPNDTSYPSQWHLPMIGADLAWNTTTGDPNVLIAVLDTGIEIGHPDLPTDEMVGVNVYDNSNDVADLWGHGTSVAGIIGASSNNRSGVASLAWDCSILPIRVTDDLGRATSWLLAAGVREAVASGASVINISFAPLSSDRIVLRYAQWARRAGALVVIASGNTGQPLIDGGTEDALFVGAVMRSKSRAPFSTYGPFVDLVAPGMGVLTTSLNRSYAPASGTSFAAPIVSGVAALIWSVSPDLRPVTVAEILTETAEDLGTAGQDDEFGAGMVDAQAAVARAMTVQRRNDSVLPSVSITWPKQGASLRARTSVRASAYDQYGIADVTLLVDDQIVAEDTFAPYVFSLDPRRFGSGSHTLTAQATDTSGNVNSSSVDVVFSVSGDTQAPTVVITSPIDGVIVQGVVTIMAIMSDTSMLDYAEVLVDGEVIATVDLLESSTTVAHNWNTTASGVAAGAHTLSVRATDTSGNQTNASVDVTVLK